MSLMRPFSSMRQDLDRMFNEIEHEFFGGRGRRMPMAGGREIPSIWAPPVDIVDEENQVRVMALVPGIKPESLDIEVRNDILTLTGESILQKEPQEFLYCSEIPVGKLYREIQLPTVVQSERAQADFQNGLLTVTLPKSEEARRHKIQVQRR